ncbi:MAG TPA: hypothetical protein VGM70_04125 [Pseudolysinimonas sp.]|jgi:hypothetical protein
MNNPRIRHLVQPPMSVVDRNFSTTNEVRMTMTSTALPLHSASGDTRPGGLELLVSRLAVGMLRWSESSSQRRFAALQRAAFPCRVEHDASAASDYSRLVRHVRLG